MSLFDPILQTHATSNVKICLSSRPQPAFRLRLRVYPSVSMQGLNAVHTEKLVRQKLESSGFLSAICIEQVTWRADGIILWVALVCDSLLRGYTTPDDEPMLRKRLDETSSGLKNLFQHMFAKIDNLHREHLRLYCHLLS